MENLQSIFIEFAIKAGEIIETIRAKGCIAKLKNDKSPVTEADLKASDYIVSKLAQNFPNIKIISEENVDKLTNSIEEFFIIDPLDGTKDFIDGGYDYTVNIAYIKNKKPIAGVIFAPFHNDIYFGQLGVGAIKAKIIDGKITNKMPIFAPKKPNNPLRILVSRSHLDPRTQNYIDGFQNAQIAQMGSSLKMCKIAENECDIAPRFSPTAQWDIAAGHAILLASGGNIYQKSGDELPYGKIDENGDLELNPPFIACGGFIPENWVENDKI